MVRRKTRAQEALEKAQREAEAREKGTTYYIDNELKQLYKQQKTKRITHVIRKIGTFRQPKLRATRASQNYTIPQDQHEGIRDLMRSSWISYLFYNPNGNVNARFNGTNYTIYNVPKPVFDRWFEGDAYCQTNDSSSLKRWKVGKHPSLGAFFNQEIKGKYKIQRGLF